VPLTRHHVTAFPGSRRSRFHDLADACSSGPRRQALAARDPARLTCIFVSYNLPFVKTYGTAGIAALGDPTRRAIFESLARRPKAVGELAAELPVSRPAVSQHLRVLKEAGLVTDRAHGTRRIYQIRQQGVQAIHGYLDQMWGQAMAAFQAAAGQTAARDQQPRQEEP
jgi:DNA-binding MarR family transcriptional regulator